MSTGTKRKFFQNAIKISVIIKNLNWNKKKYTLIIGTVNIRRLLMHSNALKTL